MKYNTIDILDSEVQFYVKDWYRENGPIEPQHIRKNKWKYFNKSLSIMVFGKTPDECKTNFDIRIYKKVYETLKYSA